MGKLRKIENRQRITWMQPFPIAAADTVFILPVFSLCTSVFIANHVADCAPGRSAADPGGSAKTAASTTASPLVEDGAVDSDRPGMVLPFERKQPRTDREKTKA